VENRSARRSAAHQVGALLVWFRAAHLVRSWPAAAHDVGTLLVWFRAAHEVGALIRRVCCHVSLLPAMLRSATFQSLGAAATFAMTHRVTSAAQRIGGCHDPDGGLG